MFFQKRKILGTKYRFNRAKLYSLLGCGILFVLGLALILNYSASRQEKNVAVSTNQPKVNSYYPEMGNLLGITEDNLKAMLQEGFPLLPSHERGGTKSNVRKVLSQGLSYITGLEVNNPLSFLQAEMTILAVSDLENKLTFGQNTGIAYAGEIEEDFYLDTPPELEEWQFEFDESQPIELSKDPVVLIYNTHNAETYKPTDGVSKLEGKNAGIAKVAETLAKTIENKYGLKTIRSETIHDYPDFSRSYIKSLETAQKILKANKTIQAVFDVHRDAGFTTKTPTTVNIKGKSAASIMIVIGTEHERWQENLAFAKKLEKKANELYPNLVRDIRIANNRRYNQHLHPNSLILEIGSDLNTLEEAQYSAALFAEVIASVIKGN